VTNPMTDYVGNVAGSSYLAQGETAVYYHDLGPGAKYTGTLPKSSDISGEDGNGVIVTMPANAGMSSDYTVSFDGQCNSSASMTVSALYDSDGVCLAPSNGCGAPSAGMIVRVTGVNDCVRVTGPGEPSAAGTPPPCQPGWICVAGSGAVVRVYQYPNEGIFLVWPTEPLE